MTRQVSREERRTQVSVPYLGMNTFIAPHQLPDKIGTDLYNVVIDEIKGISKRNGFVTYNTASNLMARFNSGTIREITGLYVYGATNSVAWTGCTSSSFFMPGNSSAVFWPIAGNAGTATLTLATAYSQTVTASSYAIGIKRVNSLYNYKYATTQKLMAFGGNDGFAGTAATTGSFTKLNANFTDDQNVSCITFQDVLLMCNGYEYSKWTGTGATAAVGGSPDLSDPKYIALYTIGNANFVWIGGSNTAAKKSQMQFSDVNAYETYPAANIYYVGDRDGTVITGGCQLPNGFHVFKQYSIFLFSGIPGAGTLAKLTDEVGLYAPKTLKVEEGVAYFVGFKGGKPGAFRLNSGTTEELATAVGPTMENLSLGSFQNATAEIINDYYQISVQDNTVCNDTHFIFYKDRPYKVAQETYFPVIWGNRGVNDLLNMDLSGANYLFSASPKNGFVYLENSGYTDDTTDNLYNSTSAITSYIDTAWLDFGDSSRNKELLRAYINATQSGDWLLNLGVYKDFQTYGSDIYPVNIGSSVMTWADVVFLVTPWQTALDKSIIEVLFRWPQYAKYFKFRWYNNTASQYYTVYPMDVYWKAENR